MSEPTVDPENCQTMSDVRRGIDDLDAELVRLLARRFGYMRAAARIKPDRSAVRDEDRKAQVIANAVRHAETLRVPTDLIASLWDELVEGSIAYELEEWDNRRA